MIYVLKTHQANISNLFLAVFLEAAGPLAYGPCHYPVTADGFFDLVVGDFGQQITNDAAKKFRHIHWADKIDQLQQIHSQTNQHIIFGSHHSAEIDYLKNQFGNNVTTVAVNYDTESYLWLLNDMAKNHVRLLKTQSIVPTDHDTELLNSLDTNELVAHYQTAFDQLQLIPNTVFDNFDYSVDIGDFVHKDRIANHVIALGVEFGLAASEYYDQWLSHRHL